MPPVRKGLRRSCPERGSNRGSRQPRRRPSTRQRARVEREAPRAGRSAAPGSRTGLTPRPERAIGDVDEEDAEDVENGSTRSISATPAPPKPRPKPLRNALRPRLLRCSRPEPLQLLFIEFSICANEGRGRRRSFSTLFRMCRHSATRPKRNSSATATRWELPRVDENIDTDRYGSRRPSVTLPAPRPRNRTAGRARRKAGPSSRRHSPARALCPVEQPGVLHSLCLARRELRVAAVE